MTKALSVVLVLLLGCSSALAEVYQWVDEKGVVTFKDTPPPSPKKRKKVKVYSDHDFASAPPSQPAAAGKSGPGKAASASQVAAGKGSRFTGTVELYVTSWCGYCKKAESYLKSNGIPYVVYDIEKDSAADKRHKELGGRGVPLIIIGSNRMNGYSQETLAYYLNNSR